MSTVQKHYKIIAHLGGLTRGELCGENSDEKCYYSYVLDDGTMYCRTLTMFSVNGVPCFIMLNDEGLGNPHGIWMIAKTTDCANTVYECENTKDGKKFLFTMSHDDTELDVRSVYYDPLE
jgi:hypothetical protein